MLLFLFIFKVVIPMMKLQYSICCGLDIHKNVNVATIITNNSDGISEYNQKSFSTINFDIQKFRNWLIENNCHHVCMESTGKYWIPNGLPTSRNLTLSGVPPFPQKISASSGSLPKIIIEYGFLLVSCQFHNSILACSLRLMHKKIPQHQFCPK